MSDHTAPNNDKTGDRDVAPGADASPTAEDEKYAEEAKATAPDVSEAYAKEAKLGANIQGEGQIED